MAKIIGIGGVSRSGKSTLAKSLAEGLKPNSTLILSQDDFVQPDLEIPRVKDRIDWEHPDSIDLISLLSEIEEQKRGYDYIIIEGLLAFHFPELLKSYDFKIQCSVSKETFLFRRQQETRWGAEPEWFLEHVWDSYLKYGRYANADVSLNGEEEIDLASVLALVS